MNLINLLIFREKYENNVKCQLEIYSTENIIYVYIPFFLVNIIVILFFISNIREKNNTLTLYQ